MTEVRTFTKPLGANRATGMLSMDGSLPAKLMKRTSLQTFNPPQQYLIRSVAIDGVSRQLQCCITPTNSSRGSIDLFATGLGPCIKPTSSFALVVGEMPAGFRPGAIY